MLYNYLLHKHALVYKLLLCEFLLIFRYFLYLFLKIQINVLNSRKFRNLENLGIQKTENMKQL